MDMNRRDFITNLLGLALLIPFKNTFCQPDIGNNSKAILMQTSSIAGFQFYNGEKLWDQLSTGDMLQLIREPDNYYDENAVEIYWRNSKLGYVPRVENIAIARMMDQEQGMTARISDKKKSLNPWERLAIEVWLQI
jgi:hypothetical protein